MYKLQAEEAQERVKAILEPRSVKGSWVAKSLPHPFFVRLSPPPKPVATDHINDGVWESPSALTACSSAVIAIDPGVMDDAEFHKQAMSPKYLYNYRRMNNVARVIIEAENQIDTVLLQLKELFTVVHIDNRYAIHALLHSIQLFISTQVRRACRIRPALLRGHREAGIPAYLQKNAVL